MRFNLFKKSIIAGLLAIGATSSFAHSLTPMRLTAPEGAEYVSYRFNAQNVYPQSTMFTVECFKGDFKHPAECQALPGEFWVPSKGQRIFKALLKTSGDGLYFICTKQEKEIQSGNGQISRVCARVYVGIKPPRIVSNITPRKRSNNAKQHQPATNPPVSTGN